MKTTLISAALVTVVSVAAPASLAFAGTDTAADTDSATGCVSNADYAKLANGQSLSYSRAVAGDDARMGMRHWTSGANAYQERVYAMCTPSDSDHATLTTRFMFYQGAWRAHVVDTHLGPED